jgi:enediyne core biosynthesis thioesterase
MSLLPSPRPAATASSYFELAHIVGFEETNLTGNVYYIHCLRWQGRCREMFLAEKAPEVLAELRAGLALATVRCSCEYFAELEAFDRVAIRMRLGGTRQNRIVLLFDYLRLREGGEEMVAKGEQEIACMRRHGGQTLATPIPEALRQALLPYQAR